MTISPDRKLAATAALFLLAVVTVAVAAATTSYVPLFFTIVPLIGVAWVLSREGPGEQDREPYSGELSTSHRGVESRTGSDEEELEERGSAPAAEAGVDESSG